MIAYHARKLKALYVLQEVQGIYIDNYSDKHDKHNNKSNKISQTHIYISTSSQTKCGDSDDILSLQTKS